MLFSLRPPLHCPILMPLRHFRCKCSVPDISFYRESFARKMALAGIKPHHRIALGVSGGADSMALCVLTAGWKSEGRSWKGGSSGYIDGLLGIVVDHRLRPESVEEANIVQERVMKMGIRCETFCCNWPEGRPKVGDLQEAAREMRYQIFQDVCAEQRIGVLLVAHHADDQAELFILRLSRNSGVFGLAGMAFVSQLFLAAASHSWRCSSNLGVLLVRPMLELSKGDIYEICQGCKQIWVEDPTNQSTLFARNRIRIALKNLPSGTFPKSCQIHNRNLESLAELKIYHDFFFSFNLENIILIGKRFHFLVVLACCLKRFMLLFDRFIFIRNEGTCICVPVDTLIYRKYQPQNVRAFCIHNG